MIDRLRSWLEAHLGKFRSLVLLRLAQWPERALCRAILGRLPRDSRLVAFGTPLGRFADNPAHLFVHMSQHSDLECVWVSGSSATVARVRAAGFRSERRWSWRGVRVAVRASFYVVSQSAADVNTLFADGAVVFNLWHGVGLKRVGRAMNEAWKRPVFDAPHGSALAKLFADDRLSPDWFLSTSPQLSKKFTEAFGLSQGACVELGYPRTAHLVDRCAPPAALVDPALRRSIELRRPVVGYFPTYRDNSLSIPGGAPVIAEMASLLEEQGATLVFKAHDRTEVCDIEASGAVVMPKDADLTSYLDLCDVLVTDFSSVANDFLLLGRPIVHFCPDTDEFADGRGFFFDPSTMLPGVITHTTAELYDVLGRLDDIPVPEDPERLLRHFWGDSATTGASDRVQRFIERQLAGG